MCLTRRDFRDLTPHCWRAGQQICLRFLPLGSICSSQLWLITPILLCWMRSVIRRVWRVAAATGDGRGVWVGVGKAAPLFLVCMADILEQKSQIISRNEGMGTRNSFSPLAANMKAATRTIEGTTKFLPKFPGSLSLTALSDSSAKLSYSPLKN